VSEGREREAALSCLALGLGMLSVPKGSAQGLTVVSFVYTASSSVSPGHCS
jgi:hypothetical protein